MSPPIKYDHGICVFHCHACMIWSLNDKSLFPVGKELQNVRVINSGNLHIISGIVSQYYLHDLKLQLILAIWRRTLKANNPPAFASTNVVVQTNSWTADRCRTLPCRVHGRWFSAISKCVYYKEQVQFLKITYRKTVKFTGVPSVGENILEL